MPIRTRSNRTPPPAAHAAPDPPRSEVAKALPRNVAVQLAHGLLGQTGFRLVAAPTFLPAYLFALSGSDVVVGLARSLQALGTVITPVIGASRIGHRKKILGITLAASGLMRVQTLGLALAGFLLGTGAAVYAIVLFLALMGAFQGMAQVTMNSLRAKVIPVHRRGVVDGARNCLAGLTSAGLSYVAGAYIVDANLFGNGYAAVFLTAFLVSALGWFALALTHEPRAESVRGRESIRETLRSVIPILRAQPDFRRFFAARALGSCGRMALPFYILFLGTRTELSGAALGLYTAVWMLTSSFAVLAWGLLADSRGHKVVMVATLVCWTVAHGQLLTVSSETGALVFFVLVGLASGGFNQAGQNMVLLFGRLRDIPIRLAASGAVVNLVAAAGPLIGGAVVFLTGYIALFAFTIALQCVALVILVWWVPNPSRRRQSDGDSGV